MATHDTIDVAVFRVLFPEFASETVYPDLRIEAYYGVAGNYINQTDDPGGLNGPTLVWALQLMTAHILKLSTRAANGQDTGVKTSGSVSGASSASVSWMAPPANNSWQYWLNQTQYGQQLLALLKVKSVGGWSVGGLPETSAFRKVGGIF